MGDVPLEEPGPPPAVQLTLNPNGVLRPIFAVVKEVLDHAAFGLAAAEAFNPAQRPALPTDGLTDFGFHDPMKESSPDDIAALRGEFSSWVLKTAFADCIKGISAALQEAALFCEFATGPKQSKTTWDALQAKVATARKRGSSAPLPALFSAVEKHVTAPLDLKAHVLSFNAARNCLEHTLGVVTPRHANTEDGIVMRWRRMHLFVLGADGSENVLRVPMVIQGPATVQMRIEEKEKQFPIGTRVTLSAQEFSEAMFTCVLFGWDLASKLPKLGDQGASPDLFPSAQSH